jgi:hypothetical protein
MTDGEAFYGLVLRELDGWHVRSVVRSGRRWEVVCARRSGRAIEAAAAANPLLALMSAWRKVEQRIGIGEGDG